MGLVRLFWMDCLFSFFEVFLFDDGATLKFFLVL